MTSRDDPQAFIPGYRVRFIEFDNACAFLVANGWAGGIGFDEAVRALAAVPRSEPLEAGLPLSERRAWFVYEGARIAAAAALAPIIPEPWTTREPAFRSQFLDVIERQCGPDRKMSPSKLHADWVRAYEAMGWAYGPERDTSKRTHPDMVPYDDLGQLERDKDAVFVALCEIARQWVYDSEPHLEPAPAPGPPCARCGGPHPFDTSIPSPLWNRVIRDGGLPDYLCTTCIVWAFVQAGESFEAELFGPPVDRADRTVPLIRVQVDDRPLDQSYGDLQAALRDRAETP